MCEHNRNQQHAPNVTDSENISKNVSCQRYTREVFNKTDTGGIIGFYLIHSTRSVDERPCMEP